MVLNSRRIMCGTSREGPGFPLLGTGEKRKGICEKNMRVFFSNTNPPPEFLIQSLLASFWVLFFLIMSISPLSIGFSFGAYNSTLENLSLVLDAEQIGPLAYPRTCHFFILATHFLKPRDVPSPLPFIGNYTMQKHK